MDLFVSPHTTPPSYNSIGKQITVIYQKKNGNTEPHKKPHYCWPRQKAGFKIKYLNYFPYFYIVKRMEWTD